MNNKNMGPADTLPEDGTGKITASFGLVLIIALLYEPTFLSGKISGTCCRSRHSSCL